MASSRCGLDEVWMLLGCSRVIVESGSPRTKNVSFFMKTLDLRF